MPNETLESTLVLIKPDALKQSLTGYVLSLLSEFHTGLRFAASKIVHVNRMLAEEHYTEHRGKPFFPSLIDYITGRSHYPDDSWKRRVIALVYQGTGAVKKIRDLAGPTNPLNARDKKPGCIRALGTLVSVVDKDGKVIGERMDNLIHASATDAEAEKEIKLWFKPNDMPPAMQPFPVRECLDHYYFKDGKLFLNYEPESVCLLAPGDMAWTSDLVALERQVKNQKPTQSVESIAAKYLINSVGYDE